MCSEYNDDDLVKFILLMKTFREKQWKDKACIYHTDDTKSGFHRNMFSKEFSGILSKSSLYREHWLLGNLYLFSLIRDFTILTLKVPIMTAAENNFFISLFSW